MSDSRTGHDPCLEVRHLSLGFKRGEVICEALRNLSLTLAKGECLALVGESGSGKSVLLKALLRLLPSHARFKSGEILFQGRELTALGERDLEALRLKEAGYVLQDPLTAFNPVKRVGEVIISRMRRARALSYAQARAEAIALLERLEIRDCAERCDDYPSAFSGGELQRLALALALCVSPSLLLLDEITTALDEPVALRLLRLLEREIKDRGMSVIFVTHQLPHAALLATRCAVMYAGRIVECAPVKELLAHPLHPYTRALLKALPQCSDPGTPLASLPGVSPLLQDPAPCDLFSLRNPQALHIDCLKEPPCYLVTPAHEVRSWLYHEAYSGRVCPLKEGEAPVTLPSVPRDFMESMQGPPAGTFRRSVSEPLAEDQIKLKLKGKGRPLLEVRDLCVNYAGGAGDVLSSVSFTVPEGEICALVGASGAGKSTLAGALLLPQRVRQGAVYFDGRKVSSFKGQERRELCRRVQLIFQGDSALDPFLTVFKAVSEPLLSLRLCKKAELPARIASLMERVQLPRELMSVRVGELSGGQAQRVALARALSVRPELLIADEPTASLDTTVQAQIVNLILELNAREGLTVLFITHDLALVRHLCTRVALLDKGRIARYAPVEEFFGAPVHPKAREMIAAYSEGALCLSSGGLSRRVK